MIEEFQQLIENDTRLFILASQMWNEVPAREPYNKDPKGKRIIRGYKHMLQLVNFLLTCAPDWSTDSEKIGLIGKPIFAVLDWAMGTSTGFAFFLDPEVNKMLKKVLNVWCEFLQSPDSASCLDNSESGWFGPTGYKELLSTGNLIDESNYNFQELYQCDPNMKRYGFTSWDHFFTREFNWERRPVADREDDNVIVNACESQPYRVQHDVSYRDKFWTKTMPYSLYDMLQGDESTEQFVGGTCYQAFLSALSYHRWHSPVKGTIVKVTSIPGTYYSEPRFEDFSDVRDEENAGAALSGTSLAQAYLTAVATRCLIFIQADNPAIGLICVIQVGMSEVSSVDVTVREGQHLEKGQEIGMFHFGGSTWCLLLRKGVKVKDLPSPEEINDRNVPVRSKLCEVVT